KQIFKKQNAERRKTAQSDWFDIPKAEITPEIKRHLQLLKLRDFSILQKGRFKRTAHAFSEKRRTVVDQSPADEESENLLQTEVLGDSRDKAERRKEVLQTSKEQTKAKLAEGLLII
ncbi:3945_t:CDS:2, partial [Paraglomus brasilianum]